MRVVGYTRRSKGETTALGLVAQAEAIRAECSRRGWEVELREEIKSGGRACNRPVLAAIRAELRRGDILVVAKLDRLTRSMVDFADILAEAQRRGWTLIVLQEGFDLTTASGRAMAGMLAVFAQWEREIMGERIKTALEAKRASGWDPRKLPAMVHDEIRRLRDEERLSQRAIACRLGHTRRTVAASLARSG